MRTRLISALSSTVPLWVIVIVISVVGSLGGSILDRAVAQGLITLVIVLGLGLFVSNSGVISIGHMAFVAIGAYTTAILTLSDEQQAIQLADLPEFLANASFSPVTAAVVGAFAAAVFALILAIPLMRLSGLTAALATVAVLIGIRVVNQNLDTFTRGTRGLVLDTPAPPMWVLLTVALLTIVVAVLFSQSNLGVRLIASREDEHAARSLGIRVWWERGVAWVLSAMIVAVGGALFAWQFRSINPDSFYISYTFIVVAMLVVGGINTVTGAVVGTAVISLGVEVLRAAENGISVGPLNVPPRPGLAELGLAVILLLTLILRPGGLVGHREMRFESLRLKRGRDKSHEIAPYTLSHTDTPNSPHLSGSAQPSDDTDETQ